MKSCEFCVGPRESFLKDKIKSTLNNKGVDIKDFIDSDAKQRLEMVRKKFNLEKKIISNNFEAGDLECFKNGTYGFLVIKPEMYSSSQKIENFLADKVKLKMIYKKDFIYLPEKYWLMYGKSLIDNFDGFPHGALIFLFGITLPSKIFIFKHHDANAYKELYKLASHGKNPKDVVKNSNDKQYIFRELFVKSASDSIRKSICLDDMSKRGFLEMKKDVCPAICWDFTGSFSKRSIKENVYTFNGVHTPNNNNELQSEIAILSKLI